MNLRPTKLFTVIVSVGVIEKEEKLLGTSPLGKIVHLSTLNVLINDVMVIESEGWLEGGDRKFLTPKEKAEDMPPLPNRLVTVISVFEEPVQVILLFKFYISDMYYRSKFSTAHR